MSKTFTVELSDAEVIALEYVALDAAQWIDNAVHERCRLAAEELVQEDIRVRLAAGESIQGTRDEMILNTNLPSAKVRNEEARKQAEATLASMQVGQ